MGQPAVQVGLLIVTALYTGVNVFIVLVMYQTYRVNRQQTVGSQAAALERTTPTWTSSSTDKKGEMNETITNRGNVAAGKTSLDVRVTHERLSDFSAIDPPLVLHKDQPSLRALGGKMVLEWHSPWDLKILPGEQQVWPKDWPGEDTVEISGTLTYDNGFGDLVSENFCYRWLTMFSISNGSHSEGIGGSPTCEDTRSMIAWSLAKRVAIQTQH